MSISYTPCKPSFKVVTMMDGTGVLGKAMGNKLSKADILPASPGCVGPSAKLADDGTHRKSTSTESKATCSQNNAIKRKQSTASLWQKPLRSQPNAV